MKVCPYCQEEIRDGAVKCRHCLSSLASKANMDAATVVEIKQPDRVVYSFDRDMIRTAKPVAILALILLAVALCLYLYGFNAKQAAPRPDQVVYVVDQGLLRFVKFAAAALAIFVTVGIFLYGFNLKEVAKEVREIADHARDSQRQAMATSDDIRKSRDAVTADREESEKLLHEMRESRDSIQAELEKLKQEVEQNRTQLDLLIQRGKTYVDEFQSRVEKLASRTDSRAHELTSGTRTPGKTARAPKSQSFTVPQLAALYEFPAGLDGSGQCIALIELGGGYRESDLAAYFGSLNIPVPKVTWTSVDGVENSPTGSSGPDMQVTLDIEVSGAAAPGAHIAVYFGANTNDGFVNAVEKAVADEVNRPSVISICWGAPESNWPIETITKLDRAFQRAAERGITVVCAAGDGGAADGAIDGKQHVDFPASSPWVLACGGTHLTASGQTIRSEVVWNDGNSATGGGVSNVFPVPEWQSAANVPANAEGHRGRGLPDVAANANPHSGYSIYVHGGAVVVGGTSAATPLWAGLIAILNQGLGRNLGHLNPLLYSTLGPAGVLRAITSGNNCVNGVTGYSAGPGWNACAGWGTPNGAKLLEALRALSR